MAQPIPLFDWTFQCRLDRVIDGDTCVLLADVGFGIQWHTTIRLLGLNAPEVTGASKPDGLAAKQFVADWFAAAGTDEWPLLVQTVEWEREKYGRWLGTIWRRSDSACLNDDLLSSGHAVVYEVR